MKKTFLILITIILTNGVSLSSKASESHDEHKGHSDHHKDRATHIEKGIANTVGIKTEIVEPQLLQQTITTFGQLMSGPEQTSHIRARFPGVIKSVNVTIGDQVEAGALLAVVESNKSLKKYQLHAAISGTITQRHANTGEMTQEQILFSIASFDSLWAELKIFPSQKKNLSAGQSVHLQADDQRIETTISHLLPAAKGAPYFIARAKVNNIKSTFFPGLMVEGKIVVNSFNSKLAVKTHALHKIGEHIGVFIKTNDEYSFTPLILGRTDDTFTEVLTGITHGVEYVTNNSYLIKADIEKSEAEHVH